jgi:hypothetical protein
MQVRRTLLALSGLALIAGSCGGTAAPTESGSAAATATTQAASSAASTTAPSPSTTRGPRPDGGDVAAEPVLASQYSPVEPGTYRSEQLGWPFSFTTSGEWWVQPNEPGRVVLTHPDSIGPGDRDIVFFRPTALADPADPTAPIDSQERWDVDDIDGWLASLTSTVPVTGRRDYTLGRFEATAFDVVLPDDFACGPEVCAGFADIGGTWFVDFFPETEFRVYWVDGGDHEPFAVWIGSGRDSDWFTTAEALLDTVALGEPGPHPVNPDAPWEAGVPTDVPAGPARFPVAGGIALTLDQERFVFQNNGFVAITLGVPGAVTILKPIADGTGTPVATVEDVIGAIQTSAAEIEEVDLEIDLAFPARVLDFRFPGFDGGLLLKWDDTPDRGTEMDRFARIWILDTARGPIVATAQTDADEAAFEVVVELAGRLLPTLELVELP